MTDLLCDNLIIDGIDRAVGCPLALECFTALDGCLSGLVTSSVRAQYAVPHAPSLPVANAFS